MEKSRGAFIKKSAIGTAGITIGGMGMTATSYGSILGANNKTMMMRLTLLILLIAGIFFQSFAQPSKELVQLIVTPDRADWTYEKGDRAEFEIQVLKNNVPLDGVEVTYRIQPEQMSAWDKGRVTLKKGSTTLKSKRFRDAGFLRCHASVEVDGK